MGLFSSISKGLGSVFKPVTNLIGGALNDVTGVTSSAKQAQKYTQQNMATSQGMTLEQMKQAYEYNLKEMAQNYNYQVNSAKNAIQWQMQDLKNAGLNPILAAGYGGANLGGAVGAGGVGGSMSAPSGSTGTSSGNPLELIQSIASVKNAMANAKLAESQALKTDKEAGWIDPKTNQEITESKSRIASNRANSAKAIAETTAVKGSAGYNVQKAKEVIKNTRRIGDVPLNKQIKTMFNTFFGG